MDYSVNQQPPYHHEVIVCKEDMNTKIEQTKQTSFNYMTHLEGWCTKNKASMLIDFAFLLRPETIVEIGVWGGKSLIPMAQALKVIGKGQVYGIDAWSSQVSIQGMDGVNYDWWGKVDHQYILDGLLARISQFGLFDQVTLIQSTSEDAPLIYNIDMLHIDGNHSEEASMLDVTKWVPLVRTGGLIILDDADWATNASAVKWLDVNCLRLGVYRENNEWGVWLKP